MPAGTVGTLPGAKVDTKSETEQSIEDQLQSLLASGSLKSLIDSAVEEGIRQKEEALQRAKETPAPQLPEALAVFRCDQFPGLVVQERDFSSGQPGPAIPGSFMTFRLGQFRAMTQNQVDQLDWMSQHPAREGADGDVIGGMKEIYRDNGEVLYTCRQCEPGQFVTANKERYKSHMFGFHGITIGE